MLAKPYLLFLGDVESEVFAKTAFGIRDWSGESVVGQWRLPGCAVDLGLTDYDAPAAVAAGARSMIVAVASIGGILPDRWIPSLLSALRSGLDLVSGLHVRLSDIPQVADAAAELGRTLHDVRHADLPLMVANGRKRTGKRALTVGTDCSVGKKYTALAIDAELRRRGVSSDFRATGQTGIMISGGGVAVDAVVADCISGAAERLSPAASNDHWDVIEGQGSIIHPAYAGVTLGLLHGSQPDAMILCHDPARLEIHGFAGYTIPSVTAAIEAYLPLARLTNPAAQFVGVSLNTGKLTAGERDAALRAAEAETGLPSCDPIKTGVATVVDRLLEI